MPDDPAPEPLRHARVSAAARRILETHGESGRFEFKSDSKAATATVLVAAANWVALEPSRDFVSILIGVDEVLDPETGLTTGRAIGLTGNDLSTHVRRLQDFAASTRPVPVELRIIEEGVNTKTPFLRVEVRPTFPPHFDGLGRRVIRNGASTRPLEDEELLGFYLDREARQFEARFRSTAQETLDAIKAIHRGLSNMSDTLERLPTLIDGAEAAAYSAGADAQESQDEIRALSTRIDQLERQLAKRLNRTPDMVFFRLRHVRERAWRLFNMDRVVKPTKAADKLAPRLLRHLNEPIDVDTYFFNLARVQHWEDALEHHGRPASMRWWAEQLRTAEAILPLVVGQRFLTDDHEEVGAKVRKAKYWNEVEMDPWKEDEL